MKSDELRKSDRRSVIAAVCYVVTLLAVTGFAFWLSAMMVIEFGQQVKLIYPGYSK